MSDDRELDDPPALRSRAVKLLARREHTRAELAGKLARHGAPEDVEQVVADLERDGLQSDARAAESYLRSHGARLGAARLRQTLRRKGVSSELIDAGLEAGELDAEATRARAVWVRKFGTPPDDAREWARQARFLQGRGFGSEVIRRLLRGLAEEGSP